MNRKYISRYQRGSRSGWSLRISHLGINRQFADSTNGGRERGLEVVLKFRDEAMRAAGIPLTERVLVTNSPRNTSGVIGVRRNPSKRRFEVAAIGRGRAALIPFGDNEQAALKRAAQIRREMEVKAYGATIKPNWMRALPVLNGE